MEDVLVLIQQTTFNKQQVCLNPCCSGRCSSTNENGNGEKANNIVLILVVVEDVLVLSHSQVLTLRRASLNPCCSGRCSSTFLCCHISVQHRVLILVVVEDVLVR